MKRFLTLIALIITAAAPLRAANEIQVVTSPGGITAWLVEEQSIPMVSMQFYFKGGGSLDPADKQGATNLMMGLLEEGATGITATEFAERSDELGARFSFDAGRDSTSVTASMLTANLDQSIALLRLALIEPTFDQVAFDRVQGQVFSILRSDATDPSAIASDRFQELAYPGHPYARNPDGTLETVAALTPDDMRVAFARALTKDRLIIGVVGAISAQELAPLLDDLLGDLPDTSVGEVPDTQVALSGGVEVIPFDTPQSVALFGHAGLSRDDPDYLTAYVLNHIMGGRATTARLTVEVRKKRGLTYGISTFLLPFQHAAVYMGHLNSGNDTMAEAIEIIQAEWAKMAEHGVTQQELDQAKRYLTGAYALRFSGNAAIAGILTGLQVADLGVDYISTRNDLVNAVTLDDINRVAARLYQPENLQFVVVGQPVGLVE